jgi:Kef-type K+ transport system membrane component KefB
MIDLSMIIWLVLPLLFVVVGAALRPRVKISKKVSRITGIIVAAIIISLYTVWRLTHGGF